MVAAIWLSGPDPSIPLIYENGLLKIAALTTFTLLLTYYFDLYEPQRISGGWEIYFRILLVLSALSFVLAAVLYWDPEFAFGHNLFVAAVAILAVTLMIWRSVYEWVCNLPALREKVYVLGRGARAENLIEMLHKRRDAGMGVIPRDSLDLPEGPEPITYAAELGALGAIGTRVDRVIVAIEERRGFMPLHELLDLRYKGVIIDDANALIERLDGKLPLEGLNPSGLIFTDGFKIGAGKLLARRLVSIGISLTGLLLCLPFIPFVMLAVRLSSPGPIFFRQIRVGRHGRPFTLLKFRTMKADAEADGAVWATTNDPRVTRIGKFLRSSRLDEIPQLWNVLKGDMGFVGPRPERPEFVGWLAKEIPFYELRHMIRPGITGWAQVRYQYGASLEESKRKLEYDLYYV
ncbi:MAG: exopolysaccharide biosynthesis polyprenyl glycosylphosphotransferase, partial [Terracidiphilus sp.]